MLIGLFTLLAALFFGPEESPFILPKAEKKVKKMVLDKERKKEVLAIMKDYKKEWKALNKTKKKQTKTIAKLNKDRSADQKQLEELFEAFRDQRMELNNKLIDGRLKAAEIIEQDEWDNIMADVKVPKPKVEKKLTKAEAKAKIKQDKKIQAIGDEVEAAFSDPGKREQATKYLLEFENNIVELLTTANNFNYKDQKALHSRDASREEILEVVEKLEDFRAKTHQSYLSLRQNLVKLSSDDDWPKLAKALNKFVK